MNFIKMLESHNGLIGQCQGNMDYSLFFDDLNIQLRGYLDAIFGNMISVKGNLFLCYVLIFTFVSLYGVQRKHDLVLVIYEI